MGNALRFLYGPCCSDPAPPLGDVLQFELHTLRVDPLAVANGDVVTVYVSTSDARESTRVPPKIRKAAVKRNKARAQWNFTKANALTTKIKEAGYGGIDAPKSGMPYGKEAKDELVKIIGGRCLRILIFYEDHFGRFVGDVYCDDGTFVQELMLKNGLAWHYTLYDRRPEFNQWEEGARGRSIGLWAQPNPERPWEWRRSNQS